MKYARLLSIFLLSLAHLPAASATGGPETLITACKEVIDIYASRDEERFLAGLTTGPSEAWQAGYCVGVVSEYRRHYECDTSNWYDQAERIAEIPVSFAPQTSVDQLLELSCGL
ncbi:hypothetical protein [Halopseudomonas sp.]|uniref:hypothetical protein n=1 Tax=Halopseudomonas sp. TaxID=2901191 RepID=UPI00311F221B